MTQMLPQCQNLQEQVESLIDLLRQEPSLRSQDVTPVQSSLRKAISPTFEIVFAGAFSAGKSMLINALLERELLYSAEGHATGTECYITYAEPNQEKVILTFLSEAEIRAQVVALRHGLGLTASANINQPEVVNLLCQQCQAIIKEEGGENKSERAKQAKALELLLEGFVANRERIHTINNATYSMEQLNFSSLKEASGYARRGSNSAVLKRIEYHCHHPLLQDGNVLIDTPGIDAPVERDAQLAYNKIKHPDTSAVACVLRYAKDGDMAKEETELLEMMRDNLGIRDRVFHVFNYIDATWRKPELQKRLANLISSEFQPPTRVYETSGLLGFYGSRLRIEGNSSNRWGLDTFLAGVEEPHPFVSELLNYCAIAGKLPPSKFRIAVHGFETPNENYVRILSEHGTPLIEHLIEDSGIEEFRSAITRFLTEEKRPQLFANLADDLQPLCISLQKHYMAVQQDLDSQPREIEAMKARELERLSQQLQQIGQDYRHHIAEEVNQVVTNGCPAFEDDFRKLQAKMTSRLDELLHTFSVAAAYSRAVLSHPRNATAPLMAILVEALYYLANQLEDVLVESCQEITTNFFQRLMERVRKSDYYGQLFRLLGNDSEIEEQLKVLEEQVKHVLKSAAQVECDRYVRESPNFYGEPTFPIHFQFRQALQQADRGFDCKSMVEAEPAIKQLLKLDFEPKISQTIRRDFRQTINKTLKAHLLSAVEQQANEILQKYNRARAYLEQTLEKEAEAKINSNLQLQDAVKQKIDVYKRAVFGINGCLEVMQLSKHLLPDIGELSSISVPSESDAFISLPDVKISNSNGVKDAVEV